MWSEIKGSLILKIKIVDHQIKVHLPAAHGPPIRGHSTVTLTVTYHVLTEKKRFKIKLSLKLIMKVMYHQN